MNRSIWSIAFVVMSYSIATGAEIRRVVTGLDDSNKAIALFDSSLTIKPVGAGVSQANLWVTDSSPPGFSFKDDTAAKSTGISPPDNGTVFRVIEFAPLNPAAVEKMNPNFMMNVVGTHAPAKGLPVSHPLMHRTRSVDYAVVMTGEIDLMLDDAIMHLKAGDVVIQQATNHAWINRGAQPCRILFVLMDSKQP